MQRRVNEASDWPGKLRQSVVTTTAFCYASGLNRAGKSNLTNEGTRQGHLCNRNDRRI